MDFEIIYPKIKKKSLFMSYLRNIGALVFLAAAVICIAVNLAVGGKAWSVIVLWSLYMIWTLVLRQPLVERNLISQGVRLLVTGGILLVLIDLIFSLSLALVAVPVFACVALITLGVLFFVNVSKQRHNVMPLLFAMLAAVLGSALALFVFSCTEWPMIVLAAVAVSLLVASVFILRTRLISELQKRFHIK